MSSYKAVTVIGIEVPRDKIWITTTSKQLHKCECKRSQVGTPEHPYCSSCGTQLYEEVEEENPIPGLDECKEVLTLGNKEWEFVTHTDYDYHQEEMVYLFGHITVAYAGEDIEWIDEPDYEELERDLQILCDYLKIPYEGLYTAVWCERA